MLRHAINSKNSKMQTTRKDKKGRRARMTRKDDTYGWRARMANSDSRRRDRDGRHSNRTITVTATTTMIVMTTEHASHSGNLLSGKLFKDKGGEARLIEKKVNLIQPKTQA